MPRTNYRTPPGWCRRFRSDGTLMFINDRLGLTVTKPVLSRHWFIVRTSDGAKDRQSYRTWMDAVQDASKSSRKEQTT